MDSVIVLAVLKYAGFLISASASVWGMVTKSTYEDGDGNKRLTFAGRVSIGITLTSALVGLLSFGFEGLARRDEQAAHRAQAALEEQRQRDAEIARRQEQQSRDTAEWRYRQEQEERTAKIARRQELAIIQAATEQRARDGSIARQISVGNSASLDRMELALTELGRLAQPIEPVAVTMRVELPFSAFQDINAFSALREQAVSKGMFFAENTLVVSSSERLRSKVKMPSALELFAKTTYDFHIFRNNDDAISFIKDASEESEVSLNSDMSFSVEIEDAAWHIDFEGKTIDLMQQNIMIDKNHIHRQRDFTSSLDLTGATMVILLEDGNTDTLLGRKSQIENVISQAVIRTMILNFGGVKLNFFGQLTTRRFKSGRSYIAVKELNKAIF